MVKLPAQNPISYLLPLDNVRLSLSNASHQRNATLVLPLH